MIKSLQIENFRCFQKLDVEDFGSFNIVVGNNAGGKTAFLEAIYLPGGGPDLVFRFVNWRGLTFPLLRTQPTRESYELLWRDLFFSFNQDTPILITLKGSKQNSRKLKLYFKKADTTKLPSEVINEPSKAISPALDIIPVIFETTDENGNIHTLQPMINEKGDYSITGITAPAKVAFMAASAVPNAVEAAELFSRLSKLNQENEIVDILHKVFPNILGISVEISGGSTTLYCLTEGMKVKIPIGLVSTGINRLMQILLLIATNADGIVLIDEIENGFYYKALPKVWEAIILFCRKYNVQLFASTHSDECLQAIWPFVQEQSSELRVLRAETSKNSGHSIRIFKGSDFEGALATGVDIR